MALLNRFSKLNDRGETGIFTFIVTRSVTRDLHRDATTKDFCFGYHRWAISFQRPNDKMLGVHLLLRNASPNTACVVDFTLTLLNREHFSQNQVYSKRQAKFNITNPMQGVSRWIELRELTERRFSDETGEFLFELSLSNMTTIFECDIQLNSLVLSQYKQMLKFGSTVQQPQANTANEHQKSAAREQGQASGKRGGGQQATANERLINLESNCFTFGSFDWSLTIVPLVVASPAAAAAPRPHESAPAGKPQSQADSKSNSGKSGAGPNSGKQALEQAQLVQQQHQLEPVCRIYLNRLNGFDSLCRVKYRVILGHHQPGGAQSAEYADSKLLDQISDCDGRIRGFQFRQTNILKLVSLRHQNSSGGQSSASGALYQAQHSTGGGGGKHHAGHHHAHSSPSPIQMASSVDLRVHIEMFCANTISEAKVPLERRQSEPQVSNCSDRNKQAWCVEADHETGDTLKLKLFFMDLQSVPRNHIRYISWTAYLVRRDPKSGQMRDSVPVCNAPHSNYYLQDGMDMGTIMDTEVSVRELNKLTSSSYLDAGKLTVHIEWVDSLLLFSHLYNNYDALATIQRHQISRELLALQKEFDHLEGKYLQTQRTLSRLSSGVSDHVQTGRRRQSPLTSPGRAGGESVATTDCLQLSEIDREDEEETDNNDGNCDGANNTNIGADIEPRERDTPNNSDGSEGPLKQNGRRHYSADCAYGYSDASLLAANQPAPVASASEHFNEARSTSSFSLDRGGDDQLVKQNYGYITASDNMSSSGRSSGAGADLFPPSGGAGGKLAPAAVQSPPQSVGSSSGAGWRRDSGPQSSPHPTGNLQQAPALLLTLAASSNSNTPRRRLPQPTASAAQQQLHSSKIEFGANYAVHWARKLRSSAGAGYLVDDIGGAVMVDKLEAEWACASNDSHRLQLVADSHETGEIDRSRALDADSSHQQQEYHHHHHHYRRGRKHEPHQLHYLNSASAEQMHGPTLASIQPTSPARLPLFGRGGQVNLTGTSISYVGGGGSRCGNGAETAAHDDRAAPLGGRPACASEFASAARFCERQFVRPADGLEQQRYLDRTLGLDVADECAEGSRALPLELLAARKRKQTLMDSASSAFRDAERGLDGASCVQLGAARQMFGVNSSEGPAVTSLSAINGGQRSAELPSFLPVGEQQQEPRGEFPRPGQLFAESRLPGGEANRWIVGSADGAQQLRLNELSLNGG